MAKPFDPLGCIPSPEAVRRELEKTLTLATRLKILLEVAERISGASPAEPLIATGGPR